MNQLVAFMLMRTLSCCAYAADITSTINEHTGRGAQGGAVTASCGEFSKTATTAISRQYRLNDVPDASSCKLTIQYKGATSEPEIFSTTSGRMSFSRRIRAYQGRLVIL